jgi:gas vesicle protein
MAENDSSGFLWFLAGLGIGAAVGVLYAPRPGRETRESILEKAEESREFVASRARQAKDQASDWVERGRDVVQQQKDQLKNAMESARQAYREATTDPGTKTP